MIFSSKLSIVFLCSLSSESMADVVSSQFSMSFGANRLNSSLGSSVSLERALDHEKKQIDAMDLLVSNTFACASYQDGQEAG